MRAARRASGICLLLLLATRVATGGTPLLPEPLDELRREGFLTLFDMNYTDAKATFEKMIELDPKHPAGYVYLANAVWNHRLASLRLLQTGIYNKSNSFFRETKETVDPEADKEFYDLISKAGAVAEERLRSNRNDVPAIYYLGIAKNIKATYEATVKRSFFAALRSGSKGVSLHRKVMEKDPSIIDAQLSVGMYNYIVGSLPVAIKILAFFGGLHGSKKQGLQMLERVMKEGNYAKEEAAALLVLLYGREKRLEDSRKILEQLSGKYPGNKFFRLELASVLTELKQYPESFQVFGAMLRDPDAMDYMADMIHYKYAEALFDSGSYEPAYDHFVEAGRSPKAPTGLITMTHLESGKCLDALGKRDQAIAEYKLVLRERETLDSHDRAKKYLKKPFQP